MILYECRINKLGTHGSLAADERRAYLSRGLDILQQLKAAGRLPPNQDWTGWFEGQLQSLGGE